MQLPRRFKGEHNARAQQQQFECCVHDRRVLFVSLLLVTMGRDRYRWSSNKCVWMWDRKYTRIVISTFKKMFLRLLEVKTIV